MFGLSFGEFVVIAIVALVVVGPKELPSLLRSAAQGLARLRRMATDIRAESGIDEALELDGLRAEIQRLRSLTNVETLLDAATQEKTTQKATAPQAATPDPAREYPPLGPDCYGAISEDEAAVFEAEGADALPLGHGPAGAPTTVPALSPTAMRAAAKAES